MQTFSKTLKITAEHLDELQHVNNVQYVLWVNEIAKAHWFQNATQDLLNNFYWVMINHMIDYKSSAFINENLVLKTYVTKAEGVSSTRIVEIHNSETDKLIMKSETTWCLMNTNTKRPARISRELANLFN